MPGRLSRSKPLQYIGALVALIALIGYVVFGWRFGETETLFVAAGIVLFLFPEPITSTAGLLLIGAGVLIWIVSWLQ